MGFYGNITNTSRTQFQFDLIYPSRYKMETQCSKDGVYVGRYVLIEYDSDPNNVIKTGYRKGKLIDFKDGSYLYAGPGLEEATKITYYLDDYWDYDWSSTDVIDGVIEGTIVRVKETIDQYANYDEDGKGIGIPIVYAGAYSFFECIGKDAENKALFKRASAITDNYTANYEEDKRAYPTSIGRGWDSTVWQKVYENGKEKYVMIAELNAVVPTFDIQADAPSMSPLTPHFDEASTNVYYKLHWQPQWGLRVRADQGDVKTYQYDKNGKIITTKDPIYTSTDNFGTPGADYPSDATTKWEKYEYDTINGVQSKYQFNKNTQNWEIPVEGTEDDEKYQIPAAIYFNLAGFYDWVVRDPSLPQYDYSNEEWDGKTDFIALKPTGWSGHQYSSHGEFKEMEAAPDTQELIMMLPSIGNTISAVWDLVYGGLSTNDAIKATGNRNKYIEWENPENTLDRLGLRLVNDKYAPITLDQMPGGFQEDTYYYWDAETASYKLAEEDIYPQYFAKSSGYTFDKAEVATIAGCINSVHDLMGMIVVDKTVNDDPDNADFETISSNHIYFYPTDGTFRVKDNEYSFTPLPESDFTYTPVNLEEKDFTPYVYFIKDGENFKPANNEAFIPNTQYYTKTLNTDQNSLFDEVKGLAAFERGYYRTDTGSYIYKADGSPDDGVIYYDIDPAKLVDGVGSSSIWPYVFTENYEVNKYYYKSLENQKNVYTLIDTDICDRTKAPFYLIPQETGENNHPYTIPIQHQSNYSEELEVPPQDAADAATWKGPYYSYEGFWDENSGTWLTNEYVYPTYFFTMGTYWQKYANDDEDVDNDDKETVDDATYKALISIPNDGFGYILDRPRINTSMPDEEPQYGDPLQAYKVKLLDYDALDEETKKHLYWAATQTYEDSVLQDDGTYQTVIKTRFLKWVPVTRDDINEFYSGLGLRQGNGGEDEPDLLMPKKTIYYIKTSTEQNGSDEGIARLFESNRYYYKGSDGLSYIKDRKSQYTANLEYYDSDYFRINQTDEQIANKTYAITPQGDNGRYYSPNKYYFYDPDLGKYVIDMSAQARTGVTYWVRNDIYVAQDTSNTFAQGSVWNTNATIIPNTITLSKRTETPVMKELEGFARSFNTLNGLILEMNRLIKADDYSTRDRNTLQGAINYLNDIIAKFDVLMPGDFPVVDYFGRLHGAHAETDKWIDVKIDPNIISPKMIITHEYNPISKENESINMNDTAKASTIEIPIYTFDETGHQVGKAKKTVTLPSSFKTFIGNNNLESVINAPTATENLKIEAANAQDEIKLEGSNKWIGINIKPNEKTIQIGHVLSGVTAQSYGLAQNETLGSSGTLETDKTFEVPYFTVDKAGHITAASTKTVSMPSGFKTFSVGGEQKATTNTAGSASGTSSATLIEDTFTFNPGNTWINLAINKSANGEVNDKSLTISHALSTLAATNLGDNTNRTPGFGETFNTLYISTDSAGHLTGAGVKTVRIPGIELIKETVASKNVIIGIDYSYSTENHNGVFKEIKSALGDLALNSYTPVAGGNIISTDTLKGALSKLETSLSVINGDVNTTGSIAAQIKTVKNEILGNCTEDFNSLAKIESWVSDKTEGEKSLITRVKALEDKSLPEYTDLIDEEVYLMKMIGGQPTWINLASWTGGNY